MTNEERIERSLNSRFRRHFGGSMEDVRMVSHEVEPYKARNMRIQLRAFVEERLAGAVLTGWEGVGLKGVTREAVFGANGKFEGIDEEAPEYRLETLTAKETAKGLAKAAIFFEREGEPVALCAHLNPEGYFYERRSDLVVFARSEALCREALDELLDFARERDVLRRRVIKPVFEDNADNYVWETEILPHSPVKWADVILPEGTRRQIEENVLDFARHAETLRRNGFETKRGVILHGPPGTGKTLVCRAVATELAEFTTVVLSGPDLLKADAGISLARGLRPAVVIFEDVDLIGTNRHYSDTRVGLSSLMNALDGVAEREDVLALFTTNDLAYLEEALVGRPGRVDAVIEFPMPDARLRMELVRLYSNKAVVEADLGRVVGATEGAAPAFIKELMRRTLLKAVRDGSVTDEGIGILRDRHFEAALKELRAAQNASARRLMGFC